MKINFNYNLVGLDGKEMADANIGKVLANSLFVEAGDIEPIKAVSWAKKLYAGDDIDLDKGELESLKKWLKAEKRFAVALKAEVESKIIDTINKKEDE